MLLFSIVVSSTENFRKRKGASSIRQHPIQILRTGLCTNVKIVCLFVINGTATSRSFRDSAPIDVKLGKYTVPTGN